MALYTIADLHLSLGVGKEKSMEVFGRRWQGYTEKLERNWRAIIEPEDSVVIPGDISWALGIDEALDDLLFIDALPGTKYIGKGNHDFWWSTRKKLEDFFAAHGIQNHFHADVPQQDKRNPMVEGCNKAAEHLPGRPARQRHKHLKQTEIKAEF